ncbi:MAG: hypothetical protein IKU54_04795 [Oscillospiraceae bacterium]|nr:hypothetical protein [Oscillospiraceae bacterium]
MKKALVIMACAVGFVYICLFAKIKGEQPQFLDAAVTLAQQNITIEKIQAPISTTENMYFKITNHFLSKERYELQGNIQVFAVVDTDRAGDITSVDIVDITATGGMDGYQLVGLSTYTDITPMGEIHVSFLGNFKKDFVIDKIPLIKYLPGRFLNISLTQPAYYTTESITVHFSIDRDELMQADKNKIFTKEIINTKNFNY